MPRPTNFIGVVQKLVREQVQRAIHGLLGSAALKKKAKDGRRRRRRRRGSGRPPGSKTRGRRGPGRPPKEAKGE